MPQTTASDHTQALLEGLTEPQRRAVEHVRGPLLVLAGAGSGKTRVITRRIAYLVLGVGIPPWNVLAITFTNKAAREMQERVAKLLSPPQARAVTLSTFHGLCARILRQYGAAVGVEGNYSIYDSADQQRAVKKALEELEISTSNFPPARVLAVISGAKNDLLTPEAFAAESGDFFNKTVARIYARYQRIMQQNHALDFDDLLLKTAELFRTQPVALAALQRRYQYILIDEYQDTNHAQFLIAQSLAGPGPQPNLCATGDPDQSIYGWRGANIRNILDFESHYPNAAVVRLEQNYRSTKRILAVADRLIQHNRQRKHKDLWTDNQTGDPVHLVTARDERHEAAVVVEQFRKLREEQHLTWAQMAVFYRVNSLSRAIEDALRTAAIPYQIARGTSFFERKEVKDAVAYLRLLANPADEVCLLRVLNTPARGISDATTDLLRTYATSHGQTLPWALYQPQALATLSSRAAAAVQRFAALVESWRRLAGLDPPSPTPGVESAQPRDNAPAPGLHELVQRVLRESGLEAFYRKDQGDPDADRLGNLGEVVNSAQQFQEQWTAAQQDPPAGPPDAPTPPPPPEAPAAPPASDLALCLRGFLEQISLVSDVDSIDQSQGAVTLMTLHAAKGLEFPVVAMIGVEDGLLPHDRCLDSPDQLEEERRLCFVGITRAQRFLFLTHARLRSVFGQTAPTIPSRFLNELPREQVETLDLSSQSEDSSADEEDAEDRDTPSAAHASQPACPWPPGSWVQHPTFGVGRVVKITGQGAQTRAQVAFSTGGVKTLILEYANLQPLERGPNSRA
jgi:DNA helicase-2/ATP-dependent DNA helicase PcrA